ncbi:polysaccharide biosynthesis/export family protein [Roseibium sp.]|uniref:polysaccharide biosynthesis/export family protein n=1 Tax=Roseibium sp. TaxID=1936156 RepID=UPI003296A308
MHSLGIVALRVAVLASALALGACSQMSPAEFLPRAQQAYEVFPAQSDSGPIAYRIGPLDVLSVNVFQEPELTFEKLEVDAGGTLAFPLIGDVQAAGKTASQLSEEITERLNTRYLRNAQVTVLVSSSVSQNITIEGNVVEPGVYEIPGGSTTLLQAIARAKSPTRTARTSEIAVFRMVGGERMGAVFDLSEIREGRASDPELRGGDVVVVGFDALKGGYRDLLSAAPIFNLFTRF